MTFNLHLLKNYSSLISGIDDLYGEIRNSSATISDVFKDKNPITFDYRMDPKGFFNLISESKDREIMVGRRKIRLRKNTKEKVDLRSATMVSFASLK